MSNAEEVRETATVCIMEEPSKQNEATYNIDDEIVMVALPPAPARTEGDVDRTTSNESIALPQVASRKEESGGREPKYTPLSPRTMSPKSPRVLFQREDSREKDLLRRRPSTHAGRLTKKVRARRCCSTH